MSAVESRNAGRAPSRQQTFLRSLRVNLRVLGALMIARVDRPLWA